MWCGREGFEGKMGKVSKRAREGGGMVDFMERCGK